MAKYKMHWGRCDIGRYIKRKQKNPQKTTKNYKKSIDFVILLWYHNKCTE